MSASWRTPRRGRIALASRFLATFSAVAIVLAVSTAAQVVAPASSEYVRGALLWSRLQPALRQLGNRLEVSGKERVTLAGTVTRAAGSAAIVVIWELPGKLRVEETISGVVRAIGFDGRQLWLSRGSVTAADQQLVETLLTDTAERFFVAKTGGMAVRFLGERFRLDNGRTPGYTGPFYDIYELADQMSIAGLSIERKFYYFNSDTKLLDRVRYETGASSPRNRVVVLITWRAQNDQQVPARIARSDNGAPTFTLDLPSAVIAPRLDDGIFRSPSVTTGAEGGSR